MYFSFLEVSTKLFVYLKVWVNFNSSNFSSAWRNCFSSWTLCSIDYEYLTKYENLLENSILLICLRRLILRSEILKFTLAGVRHNLFPKRNFSLFMHFKGISITNSLSRSLYILIEQQFLKRRAELIFYYWLSEWFFSIWSCFLFRLLDSRCIFFQSISL